MLTNYYRLIYPHWILETHTPKQQHEFVNRKNLIYQKSNDHFTSLNPIKLLSKPKIWWWLLHEARVHSPPAAMLIESLFYDHDGTENADYWEQLCCEISCRMLTFKMRWCSNPATKHLYTCTSCKMCLLKPRRSGAPPDAVHMQCNTVYVWSCVSPHARRNGPPVFCRLGCCRPPRTAACTPEDMSQV